MLRNWGMFVVMLLVAPTLVFAQNTGKIAGRVIDSGTGDGLPGASVAVVGTTYGSITDVDGNYFIIGVPVGHYDVQASFVGYGSERINSIDVSTGYTQEVNFSLREGIELGEIVIEYEKPLIQKDAIGVPKIVTAEEIVNLPVRGAAEVAKIQAGVVSREGSGTLNIRGGRGAEVVYYIDGVKVFGTTSLPQSAIQEQEMMIGSISARYGDAMSGVINITTKSGSPNYFGSIEAMTSEALDDYGYNLVSATVGGPIAGNKLNFFFAGEYTDQGDRNPRAFPSYELPGSIVDDLRLAPTAFRTVCADEEICGDATGLAAIPASLADGAKLNVDDDSHVIMDGSTISFDDGTSIALPEGHELTSTFATALRAEQLDSDLFEKVNDKPGAGIQDLSVSGNLAWNVIQDARLRIGGRLISGEWDGLGRNDYILNATNMSKTERDDYQLFATWTQHLSSSTFFQVQGDYTSRFTETYDPRFGKDFNDFMNYGDIQGSDVWSALRGYKSSAVLVDEDRIVGTDTITVHVPTFNNQYGDSNQPPGSAALNLVNAVGGRFQGYSKNRRTQFRLTAEATTQIGLNQLQFGAEYETRTMRAWNITASGLAGYVNDGATDPNGADDIAPDDPDLNPAGYDAYDDLPIFIVDQFAGGYGYDVRGSDHYDKDVFGSDDVFDCFVSTDKFKESSCRNEAPYQPIYYGGYVQDKIEFRDIVLNLGLRVDVFDNNVPVLKDKFARRPIRRANTVDAPSNVADDYAVYFDTAENIVGYRDLDGTFYDTAGQEVQAGTVLLAGRPIQTNNLIARSMFEDYEPQVTAMPRIGVSFPVTDRALFFASYGIVSQRPSTNAYATSASLKGTGGINNNNLKPEKTTKYELGFRQRLGDRSALTITGFFHQIENLIQQRDLQEAFPNIYLSRENIDFGSVKGMELGFDMRRTSGIAANVNYTLSFADGTGSSSSTTSIITWIDETPPNFISPLDFDQRHKMNISLDYRLGSGEGPSLGGTKILENFGVNVLATAGSGLPYTATVDIWPLFASRAPLPKGGVNGDRMPWSNRIDVRVDRRFPIGGANVTAFVWVQNLLDQDNAQFVFRGTGLPDDDGYLSTPDGSEYLENGAPATLALYNFRQQNPFNFGIPRQTRIGLRLDF